VASEPSIWAPHHERAVRREINTRERRIRNVKHIKGRVAGWFAIALFGTGMVVFPTVVAAKDGDIIREGNCSAASDWKLKLSPENGRIEVEFEVDQNRNGQVWNVTLKRDGNQFFSGQRTTKAPSGSFEVRRVISNSAGDDRVVGRAVNQKTGEVCRGVATF
jgi:hypothetical protein